MNSLNKLIDLKDELGEYPRVSKILDDAIRQYKKDISIMKQKDINLIPLLNKISLNLQCPNFDKMLKYIKNNNNPKDRIDLVLNEIKRLIKIVDDNKIKNIISDNIYQDRFHYVFGKKQRV